jgi:D-alanine-D-alanine ligase
MRVVVLHSAEALEPPVDPVLEQVAAALRSLDHETLRICIGSDVVPVIRDLRAAAPQLVFNLTESFNGISSLDSNVAALLNLLGLRYTGSSPSGLMLAGDKNLAKKVLSFHGIPTPRFASVFRGALDAGADLGFPVIVKPPQEDASIGINASSVVHDLKGLLERIDALQSEFGTPVLVEEFVEGREFYVGVLGNAEPEALPVMEMDFSGLPAGVPRVATWDAKWGPDGTGSGPSALASAEFRGTESVFPSDLGDALIERLQELAIEAFRALRLRDFARVDFRVTSDERIHVIEVNPNCYLERGAEFARAAERAGIAYEALIGRIADLAVARYSR